MEDILKDIGLSRYGDRLSERNYTLAYFMRHLGVPGNSQAFREHIMQSCGLSLDQVLAICDRV